MIVTTPDKPRYSLIVAAYNVEGFIGKCLSSLLSQQHENFEIIAVNDGSTDKTLDVIRHYANDPRLIIIDKINGGAGDARNAGINRSRGDYLMFVDGDDWVEPDLIRNIEMALNEEPDADFLVFSFYEVYGEARYKHYCTADLWLMTNSPCNKIFHRHLFDSARFEVDMGYEDLAIIPYLFAISAKPLTVGATLYNYRRDRIGSAMNSTNIDHFYDLPKAALRCLERIDIDEQSGILAPMKYRFGADWKRKFLTVEIFIPGVLHRSRSITDRATRRRYIAEMMRRFPKRTDIHLDIVNKRYGRKMALAAALYRCGFDHIAHFILHDMGAIRCWAQTLLRSLTGAKRAR